MQLFNRNLLLIFLLVVGVSFTTWGAGFFDKQAGSPSLGLALNSTGVNKAMASETIIAKLKITFNGEEMLVSLFESGASRQLLAQLPLTLDFSDFASAEKIAYLPNKLSTRNTPSARDITGDFTYYEPWGNLAIFYKGGSSAGGLYVLGRVDSGKEKLAAMQQNFTATIEEIK